MSNYPPGAEKDIRAPYNEDLLVDKDFYVSITLSGPETRRAYPKTDIDELKEQIMEDTISKVNSLLEEGYIVDDIIVIEE